MLLVSTKLLITISAIVILTGLAIAGVVRKYTAAHCARR